jgi:hypothetical protein
MKLARVSGNMATIAPKRDSISPVRAGSWIAILAATTLGGERADTLRAEVRADGMELVDGAHYRLVVHTYDDLDAKRPIGSIQREVTGSELRDGVQVSLIELRSAEADGAKPTPMVIAWIETGNDPAFDEYDGRTARPQPGSLYGRAKRTAGGGPVQISLNRKLAA